MTAHGLALLRLEDLRFGRNQDSCAQGGMQLGGAAISDKLLQNLVYRRNFGLERTRKSLAFTEKKCCKISSVKDLVFRSSLYSCVYFSWSNYW